MKKIFLQVFICLMCFSAINAQINYSDDFEAYAAGTTIVTNNPTNWRTWGSTAGGAADDAYITDQFAASGKNSIKIKATSDNGGPEDIILKIGNNMKAGTIDVSWNMLVAEGKVGYFNFQTTPNPGTGWAMEFFMNKDGSIDVVTNSKPFSNRLSYNPGKWFNFRVVIDASNNIWQVYIDGECKGVFRNNLTTVSSIDFFAIANGEYYIDDVVLNSDANDVKVYSGVEAGIMNLNITEGIQIAGTNIKTSVQLYNVGADTITSIEYSIKNGGDVIEEKLEGLSLAPNKSQNIAIPTAIKLADGDNALILTLTKINGKEDELSCNNILNASAYAVQPAKNRKVLLEEGTGTWCGWCPRGAVFLSQIYPSYDGYLVPIAVHNGDPMTVSTYDKEVTSFNGFTGFPGMIVDRRIVVDPSAALAPGLGYLREEPDATLLIGATEPEGDGSMKVSVSLDYLNEVPKGYSVVLTIVEDQVKGSTAQYNQANYYSGGGSGQMGGYENLPNPVPAAQMVYEHVARTHDHSVKNMDAYPAGEKAVLNYTVKLNSDWNQDEIKIVAFLLNTANQVSNVDGVTLKDAYNNGFVSSTKEKILVNSGLTVYPNPVQGTTTIAINLDKPTDVTTNILDAMGRIVLTKNYGKQNGHAVMNLDVNNLAPGSYTVLVRTTDGIATHKMVVQ